jgi:hypothetical protein
MARNRPPSVLAIGILNMVFGGIGLCCSLYQGISSAFSSSIPGLADQAGRKKQKTV